MLIRFAAPPETDLSFKTVRNKAATSRILLLSDSRNIAF